MEKWIYFVNSKLDPSITNILLYTSSLHPHILFSHLFCSHTCNEVPNIFLYSSIPVTPTNRNTHNLCTSGPWFRCLTLNPSYPSLYSHPPLQSTWYPLFLHLSKTCSTYLQTESALLCIILPYIFVHSYSKFPTDI